MVKSKQQLKEIHDSRNGKVVLGILALIAAWLMFLRASDTGSLQQYAMLIALTLYGLNRLFRAVIPKND